MTGPLVVVGGGLAAGTAVETLRAGGADGRIDLIAAEDHLPYERPPLSKGFLLGTAELASTAVHPREWYADHDVTLHLGAPATGLDLGGRTVTVGGEEIAFDKLLLATGSAPRRLPLADDSGVGVTYLRTLEDSQRIRHQLEPGRRLGIIGAGWIGLEVAAAARTAGCEVVVVESLAAPLLRALGPEVAAVFADLHRGHGVDLRTSTGVLAVDADGGGAVLRLDDGTAVAVDHLVVGVGVAPVTGLAEAAGLEVDNGVRVDERLQTSHPDVFAAGDVANAFHPTLRRYVRVEHWDNAIAQGRTAARNLLGGAEPHDRLPYFFTDQYDLGMEYVGNPGPDGYDEVVLRGDVAGRQFTALWLRGAQVVAGMHVNDWDAIDPIRRIVAAGDGDAAALRDPAVGLDDLAG